ncbi:ELM1/GtrOC1 family putative glycosyltransferase [Haloferula sp. BvORR071]|uniref:mitochondrial fission ELM1 family protein n=1 Tax=Haloferula sp. BvORR071 TaxID=1396141 RepID=UPI000558C848|nr:ELM1/GtrOC1 family putative glycosyltransferase [Haloferula sp. BvORR071]
MKPLEIQILSDGKPGHENQSIGLAQALGRLRPVKVSTLALGEVKGTITRFRTAWQESSSLHRPQLLIGAGHATHPALLALARRYNVPCVVLMKPTLPAALFDLCLIPEHDLSMAKLPENVIATRGALNRVPPPGEGERSGGVILLGGPSSNYGWDGPAVIDALKAIVSAKPASTWTATDSRRSPQGSLEALAAAVPGIACHPHTETGPAWVGEHLAKCTEAWVTEESVSMIYEALSSGARVGLLPVPPLSAKKKGGRVARGIARLAAEGYVTRYSDWAPQFPLAPSPQILREADRCAAIVLEKLLPKR